MRGRTTAGAAGAAMALLALAVPAVADGHKPDLTRFYTQHLTWGGCTVPDAPHGMECAELTVPIDYARPEDGTIALAVGRIRAAESGEGPTGTGTGAGTASPTGAASPTAPKGSLVFNFGGPGESGLKGLGGFTADTARLAPAYDLVSFDPGEWAAALPCAAAPRPSRTSRAPRTAPRPTTPRAGRSSSTSCGRWPRSAAGPPASCSRTWAPSTPRATWTYCARRSATRS